MPRHPSPPLPLPTLPPLAPDQIEKAWQDAPRLLSALAAAGFGAWSWNLKTGETLWSAGTHRLFGLTQPSSRETPLAYLDLVYPADRERVEHSFRSRLTQDSNLPLRHRVQWPDGSIHWLELSGTLEEAADGQYLVGVIRDVTQRQQREDALDI